MNEHEVRSDGPADWRAHFISLAEDLCRRRGETAIAIVDEPGKNISMRIPVDGMAFDVIHLPDARERLLVHCRLGLVLDDHDTAILEKALMANTQLALSHAGMLALDETTGELIYSTAQSLRDLTAEELAQNIAAMAAITAPWMQRSAWIV